MSREDMADLLEANRRLEAERDDLKADVGHHRLQIRLLVDREASLLETVQNLRQMLDDEAGRQFRLCAFMPGDRVLCLWTDGLDTPPKLLAGVVSEVRIPGPIKADHVICVELDEPPEGSTATTWWEHNQVEPFRG